MKNIDKVMLNEKIKANIAKEYIIERYCPSDFGLNNLQRCGHKCTECWNMEVKE